MTRGVARIVTWQKPISFRSNGGWTQILLAVSLFTALLSALLAWLEVGTGGTLHVGAGTATAIAAVVVFVELWVIAFIQNRYMETPFLRAAFQVVLGGSLVLAAGILIGNG